MATKRNHSAAKVLQKKADDAVVYQVMVALALLCCALLGLRALRSYYATVGGFTALYDYAAWIGWGGVVLAGAALAATILWKNRVARVMLPWFCALGAVAAATGFSMRLAWVDGFSFLYYFCGAMALQYIVFKLYRWEFFLLSLSTVLAGGLYFCLSNGAGWTPRAIFLLAALTVSVVGTTLLALLAGRQGGTVRLLGRNLRIFGKRATPVFILAANGLWVLCTVAVVILGSLFAYYCMFAAIAVEFIAAVYYTFQLN